MPLRRQPKQIEATHKIISTQADDLVVFQNHWSKGSSSRQSLDVSCNDLHDRVWSTKVHDQTLGWTSIWQVFASLFHSKQSILHRFTSEANDLGSGNKDSSFIKWTGQLRPISTLHPNPRSRDDLWQFFLRQYTSFWILKQLMHRLFTEAKNVHHPTKSFRWETW